MNRPDTLMPQGALPPLAKIQLRAATVWTCTGSVPVEYSC